VLPSSPAWPQVNAARSRLSTLSDTKTTYPEFEDDVAVVRAYGSMLDDYASAVSLSLFCARSLARWSALEERGRLRDALEKLAHVLALSEQSPDRVTELLFTLANDLSAGPFPVLNAGRAEWFAWLRSGDARLAAAAEIPQTEVSPAGLQEAWEYLRSLLLSGKMLPQSRSTAEIVRLALQNAGPFALVKLPTDAMTVRDWSVAFLSAVSADADGPPPWVAFASLRALGWSSRLHELLKLSRKGMLFRDKTAEASIEVIATSTSVPVTPKSYILASTQPGSVIESWKPEQGCSLVALRSDEWVSLQTHGKERELMVQALAPDALLIDLAAASPDRQTRRTRRLIHGVNVEQAREFIQLFRTVAGNRIGIVTGDSTESNPFPQTFTIVDPKSASHALQQLFRQQMNA
jgi:hypothetical protein